MQQQSANLVQKNPTYLMFKLKIIHKQYVTQCWFLFLAIINVFILNIDVL